MKNYIGKFFIILICVTLLQVKTYFNAINAITLDHEISIVQDNLPAEAPTQSVLQYTPPAPYNNLTFTITAPAKVSVGQKFSIDYTIHISKFTFISYWSDLVPDPSQGANVKLIDISYPSIGNFNADNASRALKGGRGIWEFPQGLPGSSVQHLKIKVLATSPGLLKFATVVATNPPFHLGTAGIVISYRPPVASFILVRGSSDQPLEISILDYITADSALQIASISRASYGSTNLNEDYTVTYTPYRGFYGNDSFKYKVIDGAGNEISGIVYIIIDQSPIPKIVQ
jgi:hypothetical protein